MNRLLYLSLLISGLSIAACQASVSTEDPDGGANNPFADASLSAPDAGDAPGSFNVTWQMTPGCPDVDSAAEIISMNQVTDEINVDVYDCTDGVGETGTLPAGTYDVWLEVTNSDGTVLQARSLAVQATVTDVRTDVAIPSFLADSGFFSISWTFFDGKFPLACDDFSAESVQITSTIANTQTAIADVYDCDDGSGTTGALAIGDYTVVLDILDDVGSMATSMEIADSITFGNALVDLGNVEFHFD